MKRKNDEKNITIKSRLKVFLALGLLLAPLIIFFVFWYQFSRVNSLLLFVSGFGVFIMGGALLVAYIAFLFKKPDEKVWWIPCMIFMTGIYISAFPTICLFFPKFYGIVSEKQVAFYIQCALAFFIMIIYHILIRCNIKTYYTEHGIRKRNFEEFSRGWCNYWFYSTLEKKKTMGWIRYPIIISTCLYTLSLCSMIIIGWWEPVLIFVGFSLAGQGVLNGILVVWSSCMINNRKKKRLLGSMILAVYAIWRLGFGIVERVCQLLCF